ncbi:MAG TPA: cupredoxin family copper-binding protein [Candidatus Angelobacter sp.]|nr:cupredoxin family copper-binding protein [Candidatus Angelobacter sp.]
MRAARRRTLTIIAVIGLSLLWAAAAFAVGADPARAGSGHSVEIVDFAYAPPEITITVGDSVTWTNRDAIPHTATATDGSWDTGLLDQDESGTITFTAPGTYEYLCTPHPTMTGRVIVLAAASQPAAPTPTPAPTTGGSLPDVAMSAAGGSSLLLTLLGTVLVGVALLAAAAHAVSGGRGEPGDR